MSIGNTSYSWAIAFEMRPVKSVIERPRGAKNPVRVNKSTAYNEILPFGFALRLRPSTAPRTSSGQASLPLRLAQGFGSLLSMTIRKGLESTYDGPVGYIESNTVQPFIAVHPVHAGRSKLPGCPCCRFEQKARALSSLKQPYCHSEPEPVARR